MVQTAVGDRRGVSILLHLIRRGKYDGTIPTVQEEWELWLFSPAAGRKLAGETKGIGVVTRYPFQGRRPLHTLLIDFSIQAEGYGEEMQ
jgi:hypothetical protein